MLAVASQPGLALFPEPQRHSDSKSAAQSSRPCSHTPLVSPKKKTRQSQALFKQSFRRDRRKSLDLDERSTPPKKPRGDETPPLVPTAPPPYNHREMELANCKENCRRSVSPEQDAPADLSSVKRSSRSPSPGRRFLDIKAEPLQLLCNNRDRIERSERGDDSPGSRDKVAISHTNDISKTVTFGGKSPK